MKDISIIIPVYNAEEYLDKCIQSILTQTSQNLEIILVDDGSTDKSSIICDAYAQKDHRVVVIHQKNAGVSVARNTGIDAATGRYIGFVDSDDWIEPDMFEKLLGEAIQTEADIVMCDATTVYSDGKTEQDTITQLPQSICLMHDEMKAKLLLELAGSACRCLYSRDMIREKQICFPIGVKFSEDRIFNLYAMGYVKQVCYLKESYYNRYMNLKSAVHRFHPDYFEACKMAARETQKAIAIAWNDDETYQTAYLSQLISGSLMAINNYYYKTSTFTAKERKAAVRKLCDDEQLRQAIQIAGVDSRQKKWILGKNITMLSVYAKLANWKHGR